MSNLPYSDEEEDLSVLDPLISDTIIRYEGPKPDPVKVQLISSPLRLIAATFYLLETGTGAECSPVDHLELMLRNPMNGIASPRPMIDKVEEAFRDGAEVLKQVPVDFTVQNLPLLSLVQLQQWSPIRGRAEFFSRGEFHLPSSLSRYTVDTLMGTMAAERVYMDTLRTVEEALKMLQAAGVPSQSLWLLCPLAVTQTVTVELNLWQVRSYDFPEVLAAPLKTALLSGCPIFHNLFR